MLCSLIFYDTSRLARGILCDGKNSSTLCIIRLNILANIAINNIYKSLCKALLKTKSLSLKN